MNTPTHTQVIPMKPYPALILLVIAAAICIAPVAGSSQYIGGSPQMTAYISGVNEFSPGQDATISVVIQNSGTNEVKVVGHTALDQADLPTTAKLVTAGLSAGDAPIVIKTEPQDLGDIASPGSVTVSYTAKITSNATLGDYQIPLMLTYRYLSNSNTVQPSSDTLSPVYSNVSTIIPLTIRIKPVVKIAVLSVTSENLIVGTEGYVNLTIRNDGTENGKQASVILLRNGDSPVIPTDSSVYIGDFPVGQVVSCLYKVSVSNDAEQQQSNPVDVKVTYTNAQGESVDSMVETVGVPVGGKLGFAVTSPPASISPGETKVIEVDYRNTGSITAYHAQARLTLVEPFSGTDTLAYLGDVAPGQTVSALYTINAGNNAVPAVYQLDTDVRYRDTLDNSLTSDPASAQVQVVPKKPADMFLPVAILIAGILVGIWYYVSVMKRKR